MNDPVQSYVDWSRGFRVGLITGAIIAAVSGSCTFVAVSFLKEISMGSTVLKSVSGSTLTFDDESTLEVPGGVFVKLDGEPSSLGALQAGDVVKQYLNEDGELSVLKVSRAVPTPGDGSSTESSPSAPTAGSDPESASPGDDDEDDVVLVDDTDAIPASMNPEQP